MILNPGLVSRAHFALDDDIFMWLQGATSDGVRVVFHVFVPLGEGALGVARRSVLWEIS